MNITEAEFDALEYVAIEGRVAAYDGPHIWSLLERLRPFAKRETDSPQAVAHTPQPHTTPGEGAAQGRCTLTTYERDVLRRMLKNKERLAGDATEPRGWVAMQADTDADVLRGLLERLG